MRKPVAVDMYNHLMNGADRNDQHCTYYSFLLKTLRWWRKVCFYLLECATVNSFILHKEACHRAGAKPLITLDFHRSVIEDFVQDHLQKSGSIPLMVGQGWDPLPFV